MRALTTALVLVTTALLTFLALVYRLRAILNPRRLKSPRNGRRSPDKPSHLLIVLGSGGHTAEMIGMLQRATSEKDSEARLDWEDYTHRTWVVGTGDGISAERAKAFEESMLERNKAHDSVAGKDVRYENSHTTTSGSYDIVTVPRARAIHQPLWTTPRSALQCMRVCFHLLTAHANPRGRDFPDLILCNGPATATILVFASIILRFFDVYGCASRGKMRTIYVESWARVNNLSLSGRLLCHVVDRFLVQWPQLDGNARKGVGRAEFAGVLV